MTGKLKSGTDDAPAPAWWYWLHDPPELVTLGLLRQSCLGPIREAASNEASRRLDNAE